MSRVTRLLVLGALLLFQSCPNSSSNPCDPSCDRGKVCDESKSRCVSVSQPRYEGELSGAYFDTTETIEKIYFSAINREGDLVVSEFTNGGFSNTRLIASLDGKGPHRSAIITNEKKLLVVWRENGAFMSAHRTLSLGKNLWGFEKINSRDVYEPTADFDLVQNKGVFSLVFRDKRGDLKVLTAPTESTKKEWSLEIVDKGEAKTSIDCDDTKAVDLGYELEATAFNGSIVAVYYDRRCGDLRMARNKNDEWKSTIVDDGNNGGLNSRVGAHPSISINAKGDLYISYMNLSKGALWIAIEKEGRFTKSEVDGGTHIDSFSRRVSNEVGAYNSILIGTSGAKIVYFDGSEQRLVMASLVNEEWKTQSLKEGDFIIGLHSKWASIDSRLFVFTEKIEANEKGLKSTLVTIEVSK